LALQRDCNEKDIKIDPSKMKILYTNLGYNFFNIFHCKMLIVNNLYTNAKFCGDHEVAPKIIIRVNLDKYSII